MIKYLENFNLVENAHTFDAIAHQCNCFCNMGRGIAPQIKRKYSGAFEADLHTEKGDKQKLGTFSKFFDVDDCVTIYNLYGQYNYTGRQRNTDYNALRKSLRAMNDDLGAIGLEIGLPKIGAGLGGGDWDIIEKIIEEELKDQNVSIAVFNPKN